jgi:hypothetical protein
MAQGYDNVRSPLDLISVERSPRGGRGRELDGLVDVDVDVD